MRLIDADALIEFCAERWIPLNIDAVNMQPTIQPKKAQLSQEGATFDTISRQAAIDECNKRGAEHIGYAIAHLPTIQPQSTAGQLNDGVQSTARSTDLIDRQQAIDIVVFECGKWTGLAKEISEQLKQLPPAQPAPHEGYWIEGGICRDVIECYCSECGQLMTTAATVRMNYCPKCGAKMEGATT